MYSEEEFWKEDLDKIEKNWKSYIKIERMSSIDAFKIVEDSVDLVSNIEIRDRSIYALNKNKPFKNFKYEVDYDEAVRQKWFKFKAYKYEEWVKDYLGNLNLDGKKIIDQPSPKMGFFNDDGKEYNPNLYPLPNLCMSCKKRKDPSEEIVCNLTRMDKLGQTEFKCFADQKENDNH